MYTQVRLHMHARTHILTKKGKEMSLILEKNTLSEERRQSGNHINGSGKTEVIFLKMQIDGHNVKSNMENHQHWPGIVVFVREILGRQGQGGEETEARQGYVQVIGHQSYVVKAYLKNRIMW